PGSPARAPFPQHPTDPGPPRVVLDLTTERAAEGAARVLSTPDCSGPDPGAGPPKARPAYPRTRVLSAAPGTRPPPGRPRSPRRLRRAATSTAGRRWSPPGRAADRTPPAHPAAGRTPRRRPPRRPGRARTAGPGRRPARAARPPGAPPAP